MIAFITGKLVNKDPTFVTLENHGIGYQINISLNTFSDIKDQNNITLFTYLQVREDAHTLYGFSKENEKNLFLSLISVNGIGPNTAMVMLSCMPPAELYSAIINGDIHTLQALKGIGKKSAQRIILELKEKLIKIPMEGMKTLDHTEANTTRQEALTALTKLGLSKLVAEKSIEKVLKKSAHTINVEQLVKLALQST